MQEKKRKKTDPVLQFAVGQRIKELREAHKWSQEEFADLCGVHRTYIGSAENGARNLTIQVLSMFARGFDMTVSELLAGIEQRAQQVSQTGRSVAGAPNHQRRNP